jgi:glutamate-1-semialdehyde 2,1-aminomutase
MKIGTSHTNLCIFRKSNSQEILFKSSKDAYVYDTQGNSYIDFVLGFGPVIIGHSVPEFNEGLTSLLQNGIHMPGYTIWHEAYLEKLLREIYFECTTIFFKTASEAVSGALRLACLAKKKMGLIRCGYIGWHDALIGDSVSWHEPLESKHRNRLRYNSGFRGINGNEKVFNWINFDLVELEMILDQNAGNISAFIIDAYQVSYTSISTICHAIKLCHDFNVFVIFDETKTGGRLSKLGLASTYKLDVDLIVVGKSLANGSPLSLLIGKKEILRFSEDARIGGTFSKELLGIYSALVTLEIMEKRSGFETINKICKEVVETFNVATNESSTSNLVTARQVLGGGIFEICFSPDIINNLSARRLLPMAFADSGVLLLQGHPSFICLSHNSIDKIELNNRFNEGLKNWLCLAKSTFT